MNGTIPRTIFKAEHDEFRSHVRRFYEREITPHREEWEAAGQISREAWAKAGEAGFLCATMPEEYGGAGVDRLYSAVLIEEQARTFNSGPGFSLHSDIVAPYILNYGTEAQKQKYLPRMAKGEIIGCIAMTEPGAGSDLQGVKTTAIKQGDHFLINGQKTFITNGYMSDFVVLVAKTDPTAGAKGISLILVDTGTEGYQKGKKLKKIGMHAQDTAELFFDNVRVPRENLLGEEGKGFIQLMKELAWERMQIAIRNVEMADSVLSHTVDYVKERKAFKQSIMDFQNTKFRLAEVKTEIQVARVFVDRCIEAVVKRELDPATGAMAKLYASEMSNRVVDTCLQFFGGWGYMWEFPIARAYADARVQRIFGGTSEVMKEIVARTL
ncbi:acyl-CoA dehydrogenase family protein [Desertibaculum subflavum]|uniref:acyl-CoA dehydrogenase family protein n=1 Tax=Desertibaculum subflavum TaxID=2268458 RepID=UPI000E66C8AF